MRALGISIATDAVRIVLLDGRAAKPQVAERVVEDAGTLEECIASLLATVPVLRRTKVIVVASPRFAQLRRLTGLPTTRSSAAQDQLLRENADRFFLRPDGPPATSGVSREANDQLWAGAVDRALITAVGAELRRHEPRVVGFAPSIAARARLLADGDASTRDDGVTATVQVVRGKIVGASRRIDAHEWGDESDSSASFQPLLALGPAWRSFIDAYAAARFSPDDSLCYRPDRDHRADGAVPLWRTLLAGSIMTIGVSAYIVAPSARDLVRLRTIHSELHQLAPQARQAAARDAEARRIAHRLTLAHAFANSRRSAVQLLAEVNDALPDGTALLALHVDSASGSLTAITDRSSIVLPPIEQLPGVTRADITGPITREVANGIELERLSVRFSFVKPRASSARAGHAQ